MKSIRRFLKKSSRNKTGEGSSRPAELDLNVEAPIDDAPAEAMEETTSEEGTSGDGDEQVAMEHVATEACYIPVVATTDMPGPSSFTIPPSDGTAQTPSDDPHSGPYILWLMDDYHTSKMV